jgi:hypothetical protein
MLKLQKEKVGIVGCATCKNEAPLHDESWEFWGVNNLFLSIMGTNGAVPPTWGKWFEIHPIEKDKAGHFVRRWERNFRGQIMDEYIKQLSQLTCPILMQKRWEEIPTSVEYPIAEVLSKFGKYFTNTISYEIALAIMLGAKEIGIWGVDMAVGTGQPNVLNPAGGEYSVQKPSCEWLVGYAMGLGIKVTIPDTSDLLKTRFLYAFEEKERDAWTKKMASIIDTLDQQINKNTNQINMFHQKQQQAIGAKQAILESARIWGD